MKKITIYSTSFGDPEEWIDFLSELEYEEEEITSMNEVELLVGSSCTPSIRDEEKVYYSEEEVER